MNWFKIKINGVGDIYTYVGSSPHSLEELVSIAARGEWIRLENLLYQNRGEIKEWAQWDRREEATVCINPSGILAIQPFLGDPRTLQK
jgi:hypothetical protein